MLASYVEQPGQDDMPMPFLMMHVWESEVVILAAGGVQGCRAAEGKATTSCLVKGFHQRLGAKLSTIHPMGEGVTPCMFLQRSGHFDQYWLILEFLVTK